MGSLLRVSWPSGDTATTTWRNAWAVPEELNDKVTAALAEPDQAKRNEMYIEIQKEKTGKIEEELKAQREKLDKLDAKLDRQEEARSAPAPSTTVIPAPVYPNYYPGYAYPPGFFYGGSGLSLYFGSPGFYYGRPFYGPRFFGPRYFGPGYGYRGFRRW